VKDGERRINLHPLVTMDTDSLSKEVSKKILLQLLKAKALKYFSAAFQRFFDFSLKQQYTKQYRKTNRMFKI
jgi:hypothetical protein